MIRKLSLVLAILVLCVGQVLANEEVIEQLRLRVPAHQLDTWLDGEKKIWQPWLEIQEGFLGREITWDPDREEGQLLIRWASRKQWKAINPEEVQRVRCQFEAVVNVALGRNEAAASPFPLVSEGELQLLHLSD
ncbi:TIGR03792 family protein [Synechococcus sp. M16CYN]|uniref:TIGR03792 family protein n=1 Tax=Synechococcus sp. M16CYN TaxID=3103139 RepID=UPI0030E5F331